MPPSYSHPSTASQQQSSSVRLTDSLQPPTLKAAGPPSIPKRGEIWCVDLAATVGEMQKQRFVVVVNSDRIARLPLRLIAPITTWDARWASLLHLVPIRPGVETGLSQPSAADTLQLRGLALDWFLWRAGRVSADVMEEIAAAIAAVIEYE